MPLTSERLAEIDAELDGFGKSDETLAAVVRRATELAASLAGDDALAGLLDGMAEAMTAARAAARAELPARPAPMRSPPSLLTTALGAASPIEPEVGSGRIELPEDELRKAELPPVLELAGAAEPNDADVSDSSPLFGEATQLTPSRDLEAAFAEAASSDIQGMSVDELFEDAAPAAPESDTSELSDLFDDDEVLRLSDPDLGVQPIEVRAPPAPPSVPPPVPAAAISPPAVEFASFADDVDEHTSLEALVALDGDDDFELLVDDDVLDLGADDSVSEPDETPEGGGLISRILSRKP